MKSTSETGHAKNIANLNLLITNITALGTLYNPSNSKIKLANLQNLYDMAFSQQETVNSLLSPYSLAVDAREAVFRPLNRDLSKLRKAYKATEGVTAQQLEDLMTIIRKLKGVRKTKITAPTDPEQAEANHSVSQLSYDQRTNNMDALISLLQNTPNYKPNETEYQVVTYQDKKNQMLESTQSVADTFIPLNNARSLRNATLYKAEDNLVNTANTAKDYAFTILESDSAQYKAIARIKFRKK